MRFLLSGVVDLLLPRELLLARDLSVVLLKVAYFEIMLLESKIMLTK